jgi:hypothetical protein
VRGGKDALALGLAQLLLVVVTGLRHALCHGACLFGLVQRDALAAQFGIRAVDRIQRKLVAVVHDPVLVDPLVQCSVRSPRRHGENRAQQQRRNAACVDANCARTALAWIRSVAHRVLRLFCSVLRAVAPSFPNETTGQIVTPHGKRETHTRGLRPRH